MTKLIIVSVCTVVLIAVAGILAVTGAFRPTSLLPQSALNDIYGQDAAPVKASMLKVSPDESSNDTLVTQFFPELPWEVGEDGHLFGVLEFCSDGNKSYAYGLLGRCQPGQPSPLLRMKTKHHYHLILVNNAHIDTNLHTHGLHVSGVGKSSK